MHPAFTLPRCRLFPGVLLLLTGHALSQVQAQSIGTLQGQSHRSSLADTGVHDIAGIVTAVESEGFWMQDAGDGNPRTSDAIYVWRGRRLNKPRVGDAVRVSGQVQEFRPGGANGESNLTTTRIDASATVAGSAGWRRTSSGNPLPGPIVIGPGFLPPTAIAPSVGNIETAPGYRLNPSAWAIDFFESLEGMRVAIPLAVAVGPSSHFGEIPVITGAQVAAAGMAAAARGGVVVGPGRFNGHRILLDDRLTKTPAVHSGAQLEGIVGVLDHGFGNFKLQLTQAVAVTSNRLPRAAAVIPPHRIGLASYNVQNLGGDASRARFEAIAAQIVDTLGAPQLLALQEVQDDDGKANSGAVSAKATLGRLTAALQRSTGRRYRYLAVDPVDLADGGAPGGNIRQAFLYDTARVGFSGPVGGPRDAIRVCAGADGRPRFDLGAGRIDPGHRAFSNSRKPLAAVFTIDGQQVLVINNHFNSKGGDQPLFGPHQPPALRSAAQRLAQARVVGRFVANVLTIDPQTHIVVAGDFNDFQFADTLAPLHTAGLVNLTDSLPENARYSYNHEGNLQALDHVFVSPSLVATASPQYQVVHANAEFSDALSDHDPVLLTLDLGQASERIRETHQNSTRPETAPETVAALPTPRHRPARGPAGPGACP